MEGSTGLLDVLIWSPKEGFWAGGINFVIFIVYMD